MREIRPEERTQTVVDDLFDGHHRPSPLHHPFGRELTCEQMISTGGFIGASGVDMVWLYPYREPQLAVSYGGLPLQLIRTNSQHGRRDRVARRLR